MSFDGPDPVSSCGCSCSKPTRVRETAIFLPSRGCDGLESCSGDGVRYQNGELQMAIPALQANWWGHTLIYTNRFNEDTNFGYGWNWMVKEVWQLFEVSGSPPTKLLALRGSQSALWFNKSDKAALYGSLHKLSEDTTAKSFTLTAPNGTSAEFYNFDVSNGALKGKLKGVKNPAGEAIVITYASSRIESAEMSFVDGGTTL